MTTSSTPYQADTLYDARVTKPCKVGPFEYLPRHKMEARGSLLNQIVELYGEDALEYANPK